jgi:hypothetical protein
MTNAYVETTVLTDVLLKPGTLKKTRAQSALARYGTTLLPVYSIKEFKAGPLGHYCYVHDKLVATRSLSQTLNAINSLHPLNAYKKATAHEAYAAATKLVEDDYSPPADELADRYRIALASLIERSWRKRRKVTSATVDDLDCYTETKPRLEKDGLFDLKPKLCDRDKECCLHKKLVARKGTLEKLRNAIPETSARKEDGDRRKVLKQLIHSPKLVITREQCRQLGDAVFAFFCPEDAVILTTNVRDHQPLAQAIGKNAEAP